MFGVIEPALELRISRLLARFVALLALVLVVRVAVKSL